MEALWLEMYARGVETFDVAVSMVEIENEGLEDMFVPSTADDRLTLMEDSSGGTYCRNLYEVRQRRSPMCTVTAARAGVESACVRGRSASPKAVSVRRRLLHVTGDGEGAEPGAGPVAVLPSSTHVDGGQPHRQDGDVAVCAPHLHAHRGVRGR